MGKCKGCTRQKESIGGRKRRLEKENVDIQNTIRKSSIRK